MSLSVAERFLAKVAEPNAAGCCLWTAAKTACGYGQFGFGVGLKTHAAHRVSYYLFKGEIPAGMHVLHRCDTPACVNPEHLFLGTHRENMADCVAKGRFASRAGERNGRARLIPALVQMVRDSRVSAKKTALVFGISESLAFKIKKGELWPSRA